MSAIRSDDVGRIVCQAVGCGEPARPWSTLVPLVGDVDVEVALCRRHDADYFAGRTRAYESQEAWSAGRRERWAVGSEA